MRILVVDDEPFILNLNVRILNKLGYYNIQTACNGEVALSILQKVKATFDLILCDINMPIMNGIEFMRHASSTSFKGSIILSSGEDERMLETAIDLAKSHNINVLGAIPKPLQPALLENLLENLKPRTQETYTQTQFISENELKDSMYNTNFSELTLVYQPKIQIKTGEITGVETLARWQHKINGLLGPYSFIPLAEEIGVIDQLSYKLYKKAITQIADWLTDGISLETSINFSINTFSLDGFPDYVIDTACKEGVNPEHIVLEITESQIMENPKKCLEIMMRLRMKRFGLSIDDFGTGHSSMTQLKNIPFTELKIDNTFVKGANQNSSTRAILETSVNLAKKLNMEIVAEGVETREDWDLVESLGCDYVQGYYCAKPMQNDEFMDFYKNWSGPH